MGVRAVVAQAAARPARNYVRHVPGTALKPTLVRQLLEPALRRHPRDFVVRTRDGFAIAGNTRDMIQRYLYVFGVWEPHLTAWMRRRLTPGATLLDVGANIGYFSLLGSHLVGPTGRVVSIEALPATYAQLLANLDRNEAGNVRPLNVAASTDHGTLTLYGGEVHNSGTTTSIPRDELAVVGQVPAAPLDDILTDDEVAGLRLVKIDVEGAELEVLQGMTNTLERAPEDLEVIVEVSPDDLRRTGHDTEEPIRLLGQFGFVPYHLPNDYRPVSYLEASPVVAPSRLTGRLDARTDLVFSRVDAPMLS